MSDQSCNCGCGTTATAVLPEKEETCQCGCCGPVTTHDEPVPEPETTH